MIKQSRIQFIGKKMVLGLVVLGSCLFAQKDVQIKVETYDIELPSTGIYVKMTSTEFRDYMEAKTKTKTKTRNSKIKKVIAVPFDEKNYFKSTYKSNDKIVAETIESNEIGIDWNLVIENFKKNNPEYSKN